MSDLPTKSQPSSTSSSATAAAKAAQERAAPTSAAKGAATTRRDTVVIEVGAKAIEPQIVRDGIPLKAIELDKQRFDDFFVGKPTIPQKVISQSPPPGTPVPIGSTVDLVLASGGDIVVGVVKGVHVDLADRTMQQVYDTFLRNDPEMNRILARSADGDQLTVADERHLAAALGANNVPVANEQGRDVGAALVTMRAARSFAG